MVIQNKQNKQTKEKDIIIDGIRIDKETDEFINWFWKREKENKKQQNKQNNNKYINNSIMIKYTCIIKYKNGFYYKYIPFCYSIVNKEVLK